MAEPEWRAEARRLRAEGFSYYEIGKRVGKSSPAAWNAVNPEKKLEYDRAYARANPEKIRLKSLRRMKRKADSGLCTRCGVREADFGLTQCIRCQEYRAEHQFLGYSNIKVGKESGWFDGYGV